jgi:hypothetical protein
MEPSLIEISSTFDSSESNLPPPRKRSEQGAFDEAYLASTELEDVELHNRAKHRFSIKEDQIQNFNDRTRFDAETDEPTSAACHVPGASQKMAEFTAWPRRNGGG